MASSRRLLVIGFLLLAIVASWMIVTTDSVAERTCELINVGMTEEQVSKILAGKTPSAMGSVGSTSISFCEYDWNDGTKMNLQYGSDGRVINRSIFHRIQETLWGKMQRRIRETYSRWF
jgi:hypothetical protein